MWWFKQKEEKKLDLEIDEAIKSQTEQLEEILLTDKEREQKAIEELKAKKIAFISLGCDKNRVDLEEMMYNLSTFGFSFANSRKSQIVIINTCAFILPARKEAIENIFEMVGLKKAGQLEKIIVTGCLAQRYIEELETYIPEVDKFVQVKDNNRIVDIIANLYGIEKTGYKYKDKQLAIAPKHYAFLRIADGCNNCCAYCTIPRIRGRYISIPFNEVLSRAKQLVSAGARELIVVAQDTTRYGIDLYNQYRLVELLKELTKIKDLKWIRLHYCYPELVTNELLELMSRDEKICPYIDVPLQHIDDKILKDMNRRSNERECRDLINNIRKNYSNISIRSTFIVGFPGETDKQFKKLCEFLKEAQLDNVGFFTYSREEATKAFYMKKQIPERIKNKRLEKIQDIQEEIATHNNLEQINTTTEIVIDRFNSETGYYEARTQKMSPGVDFFINVSCNQEVEIGKFYMAKIIGYENYGFIAEIIKEEGLDADSI